MNLKGGYQIIDFENKNLTTDNPVEIPGIYESIESNSRKPLLLSNVVLLGTEVPDMYASLSPSGTSFNLWYGVPTYHIVVTDNDMVSIATN